MADASDASADGGGGGSADRRGGGAASGSRGDAASSGVDGPTARRDRRCAATAAARAAADGDAVGPDGDSDGVGGGGRGAAADGAPAAATDEDELYDPHADSDDERWAAVHLAAPAAARRGGGGGGGGGGSVGGGRSAPPPAAAGGGSDGDAAASPRLSCPCCFTLLCVACQRHEAYTDHYRAVFVRNVKPLAGVPLRVTGADAVAGDAFDAVACAVCETPVGVLDGEEVYHFCHVVCA